MEEPPYFATDFDPKKAKVADLRRYLLECDAPAPATAKKPELVERFEKVVAPKIPNLIREFHAVKPSAVGIIDMASKPAPHTDKPKSKKVCFFAYLFLYSCLCLD